MSSFWIPEQASEQSQRSEQYAYDVPAYPCQPAWWPTSLAGPIAAQHIPGQSVQMQTAMPPVDPFRVEQKCEPTQDMGQYIYHVPPYPGQPAWWPSSQFVGVAEQMPTGSVQLITPPPNEPQALFSQGVEPWPAQIPGMTWPFLSAQEMYAWDLAMAAEDRFAEFHFPDVQPVPQYQEPHAPQSAAIPSAHPLSPPPQVIPPAQLPTPPATATPVAGAEEQEPNEASRDDTASIRSTTKLSREDAKERWRRVYRWVLEVDRLAVALPTAETSVEPADDVDELMLGEWNGLPEIASR